MRERERALLTGSKAKLMFGEMADIAMKIADNAGDTLLANYGGDEQKAIATVSQVLKDARRLERILTLLEAGNVSEAEAMILKAGKS